MKNDSCVVVSWNVHACIGRDDRFRPDRIADILESANADLIGVQELEDRQFEGQYISDYLAQRLDMQAYRGPSLRRGDSEYGNLLLSRLPAERVAQHDLSVSRREPRGAIEADFDFHGMLLRCLVTHLGLSAGERRQQMSRLLPLLSREDTDIRVLAADLNEWLPGAYTLRHLRALFGRTHAPRTFPAGLPLLALDRLTVAPATRISELDVMQDADARVASDHLPLRCVINLAA